jgi:hypothetical protein
MISRLAPGVFVALIAPLVRVVGVVDYLSLMDNPNFVLDRTVGQAANGTWYEKLFKGSQDLPTYIGFMNCPQCNG